MQKIDKECFLITAEEITSLVKEKYNLEVNPQELIDYSKTFESWVLIDKNETDAYLPKFKRLLLRLLNDGHIKEGYYLLNGLEESW